MLNQSAVGSGGLPEPVFFLFLMSITRYERTAMRAGARLAAKEHRAEAGVTCYSYAEPISNSNPTIKSVAHLNPLRYRCTIEIL
jgi:hypothetical protein